MPSVYAQAALASVREALCHNVSFVVSEVYKQLSSSVLMQTRVRFRHLLHNGQVKLVPQSLARHLGVVVNNSEADFVVEINSDRFEASEASEVDAFRSKVMLHEVFHGLGFFSMIAHYPQVTNRSLYSIYDHNLSEEQTGTLLVDSLAQVLQNTDEVNPLELHQYHKYSIFGHRVYTSRWAQSLSTLSHLDNEDSIIYPWISVSESYGVSQDAADVLHGLGWCEHVTLGVIRELDHPIDVYYNRCVHDTQYGYTVTDCEYNYWWVWAFGCVVWGFVLIVCCFGVARHQVRRNYVRQDSNLRQCDF